MLTVLNPATEEPIAELEQAGVEETDAAVARAKAAFPAWRAVAPADRGRLLRRLATLVEEHGEELARIESRNVGKPISGARGGDRDGRAGLPLLRGRRRQALRRDDPGRRRRRRHLPRAARRRRPDRAVELPAQHLLVEARARARVRQHGRPQACRADAAVGTAAGRARARGRDPRGRRQRPRRQGLRRRQPPRRAPGRGEDRLHRLDRGGAYGDGGRRRDDQARHARARRQVGQRRLRRCRPRAGGGGGAVRGLRQRRPGLLRALAHPGRAQRLRPLRRAADRGDARREGRRSRGRRDRDGPADLGGAPRDGVLVRRGRAAVPRRGARTERASGSRARSSRRRTTTGSPARRSSARWRR